MKIYLYYYNNTSLSDKFNVEISEGECIETEKTYKITKTAYWIKKIVRKEELNTLDTSYGYRMYSLSDNKLDYFKALVFEKQLVELEKHKKEIKKLEKQIENVKNAKLVKAEEKHGWF